MPVTEVTEPHDPRLAHYQNLTDVALRSASEPAYGIFMAEGATVIARALSAGHRPISVLVDHKRSQRAVALLADFPDTPIYVAPTAVVRAVTGYRVHRGFLSAMARPDPRSVKEVADHADRLLVLEDLVDHTNVGAAFRNAAALGFDAVVVSPRCADPLYRRSIKVSMGAVLSLAWATAQTWPHALDDLSATGFDLIALTPSPTARPLADVAAAPPRRLALLVGTEGGGLSPQARSRCQGAVRIPMSAGIDSLNAAAATAIACYALGPASRLSGHPAQPAPPSPFDSTG